MASAAFAETVFNCAATDPKLECAFSIFVDSGGDTNFVVPAGGTHKDNDNKVGLKYCVSVGPIGTPRNDFPKCWDNSPPAPNGHWIVKADVPNS